MPGQSFRRQNVRKKLSAVSCVLEGRSVLLVDDSIVRGTTSREIVRIVKEAGARKVFFCSASPPVSTGCCPTNCNSYRRRSASVEGGSKTSGWQNRAKLDRGVLCYLSYLGIQIRRHPVDINIVGPCLSSHLDCAVNYSESHPFLFWCSMRPSSLLL